MPRSFLSDAITTYRHAVSHTPFGTSQPTRTGISLWCFLIVMCNSRVFPTRTQLNHKWKWCSVNRITGYRTTFQAKKTCSTSENNRPLVTLHYLVKEQADIDANMIVPNYGTMIVLWRLCSLFGTRYLNELVLCLIYKYMNWRFPISVGLFSKEA